MNNQDGIFKSKSFPRPNNCAKISTGWKNRQIPDYTKSNICWKWEIPVRGLHLPPPKLLLPMSPTNISPLFPDEERQEEKVKRKQMIFTLVLKKKGTPDITHSFLIMELYSLFLPSRTSWDEPEIRKGWKCNKIREQQATTRKSRVSVTILYRY